jgi:hypothetical protein
MKPATHPGLHHMNDEVNGGKTRNWNRFPHATKLDWLPHKPMPKE